jgi:hypothetical protein
MGKRPKKKAAAKRKPGKIERTLVRLEKALVHETSSIDALSARIHRIEQFLGEDLTAFHEKHSASTVSDALTAAAGGG